MTWLTRRHAFSASHRLHRDRLNPEANGRVFGKCNQAHGHGHNYVLEVTVAGEPDPQSGVLVSPAAIDACVREAVLARLDHTHLNDLPEFTAQTPTTENLAIQIGRRIAGSWRATGRVRLAKLRLEETGSNAVELDLHGHEGND